MLAIKETSKDKTVAFLCTSNVTDVLDHMVQRLVQCHEYSLSQLYISFHEFT